MEYALQDPRSLSLGSTTAALLDEAARSVAELNRHRPLSAEDDARLRRALLPDRVTASLNMEGIGATRRQTLAMMDAMRVEENAGAGEIEVYNALTADEFIFECVERGEPLSESVLREINRLLISGLRPDAGIWRPGDVKLLGAKLVPPPGPAIPGLARSLVDLFPHSEALDPLVQAAWLHAQFTYVHPFNDGNGRTGRLLQDWSLIRRGYWPTGIPTSKRDDYYGALEQFDAGNADELVELLAVLQLDITSKVRAVLDEAKQRSQWVTKLASAAAAKQQNTRHKQYIVWRQRIEDIIAAFRQATIELDGASDIIGASFREYSIVDYRDWEQLCLRGVGERTWVFSITFRADGKPFYRTIAYLKRHYHDSRSETGAPQRDQIGMYFTGVSVPEEYRADFVKYDDPHIRLREILPTESKFRIYAEADDRASWSIEEDTTLAACVEQFFRDVFERKAGI